MTSDTVIDRQNHVIGAYLRATDCPESGGYSWIIRDGALIDIRMRDAGHYRREPRESDRRRFADSRIFRGKGTALFSDEAVARVRAFFADGGADSCSDLLVARYVGSHFPPWNDDFVRLDECNRANYEQERRD